METLVWQTLWSFGDRSMASTGPSKGESVKIGTHYLMPCNISVYMGRSGRVGRVSAGCCAWDAGCIPWPCRDRGGLPRAPRRAHTILLLLHCQPSFHLLTLPHTATKWRNIALGHIHSVKSLIFILARTQTVLWRRGKRSMRERES